jgi:hypothetical protein
MPRHFFFLLFPPPSKQPIPCLNADFFKQVSIFHQRLPTVLESQYSTLLTADFFKQVSIFHQRLPLVLESQYSTLLRENMPRYITGRKKI